MNIVDLLIMIIITATLVTVAIGIVAVLAFRVRRDRGRVVKEESADGLRYFVRYHPEGRSGRNG